MKIELKRISFNERLSDETNCFVADLYIDGKKAGECKNDGRGGCTDYYGIEKQTTDIIEKAEEYCKTLPNVKCGEHEWGQTLEGVIDQLLDDYLKVKEKKKIEKQMESKIMFGVPNGYSYQTIGWKGKKLSEINKITLQMNLNEIRKKYCKDGVVILNTNLESLGVI